jgi:hypothetical protein
VQRPGLARRGSAFGTLNRVLDYIFSSADCKVPENPTTFSVHRFHTAILRVNKAIHRLARIHLHHNLTWIRFDINWGSFLIDPHWLGITYIAIDGKDTQCEISYPYVSYVERRSSNQQTLEGNISVHIKFPPPATDTQKETWNKCVQTPDSSMPLLVLAEDFDPSMDVLRMNDLAYCCRRWGDLPKDGGSGKGVSFDNNFRPGQEEKGCKRMLDRFQEFHGPFHKLTIFGHHDSMHSALVTEKVELCFCNHRRERQIIDAKEETYFTAVRHILYLKHCGDEHLIEGRPISAFVCYEYATWLQLYWKTYDSHAQENRFWSESSDLYIAYYTAMSCNRKMAHVTGGLAVPLAPMPMWHDHPDFLIALSEGPLMGKDRYFELMFTNILSRLLELWAFEWCSVELASTFVRTRAKSIVNSRESNTSAHDSLATCDELYECMEALLADLPATVRENDLVTIADVVDKDKVKGHLETARQIFRDNSIKPLKWAIREQFLPRLLLQYLGFMPEAVLTARPPRGKTAIVDGMNHCFYATTRVDYPAPEFFGLESDPPDEGEIQVGYAI